MNLEYILERYEIIDAKSEHKFNEKEFKQTLFAKSYVLNLIFLFLCYIFIKTNFSLIKINLTFMPISYIATIFILQALIKNKEKSYIDKSEKQGNQKFILTLRYTGIIWIKDNYKIELSLKSVLYFVETKEYIHIYTDSKEEIFVPKNIFESDEIKNAFLGKLKRS